MIRQIQQNEFSEAINRDITTIVKFEADWCGPCKAITPSIEKISNEWSDKEVEFFLGAGVHSNASSLEEGNEKVNVSLHIEMDPVALHQALKPDDLVWSQVG